MTSSSLSRRRMCTDASIARSRALVRATSSIIWELRTAWASGRRVALSLERCDVDRLEGHITAVAATGVFIRLAGKHVPVEAILAVHLPSRLGDSTARGETFHGPARRLVPQLEELFDDAA